MLRSKHLEIVKQGLIEWTHGSLAGVDFLSLEHLVQSCHLLDVSDPDPERWRYIHRGPMQQTTALLNDTLSSCPIRAVIEQTKSAYMGVIVTGQPSIELCRRQAGLNRLDFVRTIVPEKCRAGAPSRLRVGIDYEAPALCP